MKKILIVLSFALIVFGSAQSFAQLVLDGKLAALWLQKDLKLQDGWRASQIQPVTSIDSSSDLYKVVIDHTGVGQIKFMIKGPKGFLLDRKNQYRSLVIASGFFTGDRSIHLVQDFANRVLVGFEYPHSLADFKNDPGTILQVVRKTPGQIALALKWISTQPWANPKGISIMGVSLGGVFLPSGLHLAQNMGLSIEKSIYVCTGVDLVLILRENLRTYTLEPLLNPLAEALAAPMLIVDPQIHLPYLRYQSLVIQTDKDSVIPRYSQLGLWQRLVQPKKEVILNGPHVNADQVEVIKNIQETVLKFDNE